MANIVIVDGDEVTTVGDAAAIDIDDYDCASVGDKAEMLGRLLNAMDDNHLLDDDATREDVHLALDKAMTIARETLRA